MNRHLTPEDVNDLRREVRDEFGEVKATLAEHGSLLWETSIGCPANRPNTDSALGQCGDGLIRTIVVGISRPEHDVSA